VLEPGVRFCPNDGTPLTETAAATGNFRTPAGTGPQSQQLQLPVVVGGRYRLLEVRGGGGMAKVYKAIDTTLEREVAVKLINPELRNETEFDSRFQREARISSQLADPHIVVVHDFGLDPLLGPYLVMEFLQGQSLRERLKSEGPLPLKATLQLSGQLLLALIHAHSKDIVHRDLKPDNIFLLNQSGVRLHVRVLDFGIARIFRRDDAGGSGGESITQTGAILGTPRYMSPEQLAGQPVDARSDLYSAALVMFEALTGQLPYTCGKRLCELCAEASPAYQDLLEQCLKPNPADRPSSAVEVYLRLQELGKASGVLLLPSGAMETLIRAKQKNEPTATYAPPAAISRRTWVIGAAAGLILLLGGVAAWRFWPHETTPPDGRESLLGVQIGENQQGVVDFLKLSKGGIFNPWAQSPRPAWLGQVLQPEDLGLAPEDLERLDVERSADDRVCVLFHQGKVRAMVVRQPHKGGTGRIRDGRTLHLQANPTDIATVYGDVPYAVKLVDVSSEDDKSVTVNLEIRRYDRLGLGLEVKQGHNPHVIAITLYPPRSEAK